MKNSKLIKFLIAILLIACVATVAVACDKPGDGGDSGNKKPQHVLTFISEGEQIPPIIAVEGDTITPPVAPQKDNMRFVGWFLNNKGESVTLPTVMPGEDRIYFGRYETVGTDEKPPQIPEDYNLKLNEKDGTNTLYLKGADVYLLYNNSVIVSELTADGDYAEFDINKKEYCAVIDYDSQSFGLYEYAISRDAYPLHLPTDNTFNFERCLYFEENGKFKILGYSSEANWVNGTYTTYSSATQEFDLTVVTDNTYGLFTDCRIRLNKTVRLSEDTNELVIYNAYNIFDESIFGSFTYSSQSLTLDGYGYAAYNDGEGNVINGVCEPTSVTGFQDSFVNFIDADTGKDFLFVINAGDDQSLFLPIGTEVGLYRIFDITEQKAGSYYFLLNGAGTLYVFYGERTAFYPETEIAEGTYEISESGEFTYKLTNVLNDSYMNDTFRNGFNFKLTTYGSGLYETNAFTVYDESIAGVWSAENGASTITLDGYGSATHNDGGNAFTGVIQRYKDLLLITADDQSQRVFRVTEGETVTYRQIGLEVGNYFLYSYVKGLKETEHVYFDGENRASLYVYDEAQKEFVIEKSGTYAPTANSGEYELTFSSNDKIKIATRQINFGSLYYPDWKAVYIEYDAAMSGTYKNSAGTATLVLDGYGLKGTYTDEKGVTYTGEFAKEWNLITFLAFDEEGYTDVITFKVTGSIIERKEKIAGVYYTYSPGSDIVSDYVRLFLDGDGNAMLSEYDAATDSYSGTNAAYTYDAENDEYTLTPDGGDAFKLRLAEHNGDNVYIVFNQNWKGEYIDEDNRTLVLDGYGNAEYRDETVPCTVFGTNYDNVTFNWFGEKKTFVLNKTDNTFATTTKPVGIYYTYSMGTISGYSRLVITEDDAIELQVFSLLSNAYEVANRGAYSKNGDVYTFTSASGGESFTFKLAQVGAYDVYRSNDEYASTLTSTAQILGQTKTLTLVLDGYGSATYTFYDEEDGRARTRTGYYYYDKEEDLLVFIATGESGEEYATYIMIVDWTENSFEIMSEN